MSSKIKEPSVKVPSVALNQSASQESSGGPDASKAHEWIERQHQQVFNSDWSDGEDEECILKEVECPGMGTLLMPKGFWDMIEEQEQLLAQGLLECHSRTKEMKARVFRSLSTKDKTGEWTMKEELRLKKEK